ncbi:MmcQ/YjbR family DNA-binding protein [Saccharopolyspora flava]|uniref:YjbR protein n=1 Tax=Saccharopolyspora flava TaxID=95161 RepID=A0A1I6QP61_9PSEU|nr:MmcQ/YjbR family DNA-binding protein [Saccharopolyspora flava]SFS54261.1 YjbR protein [Saccharopolyspora flava]
MTSEKQLRKAALGLPGVEEGTHFGMVSFSVRGKGFASLTGDGVVQAWVGDDDAERFLAKVPGERLARAGKPFGIAVPLADINGKDLNELIHLAWRCRAPKSLVREREEPADSDLPASIGRPATRALHGAGITTLAQAATWSDEDLLALHGFGPKALRLLAETLTDQGLRRSGQD